MVKEYVFVKKFFLVEIFGVILVICFDKIGILM